MNQVMLTVIAVDRIAINRTQPVRRVANGALIAILALAAVSGLWAQKVKSQGEAEALQAVFKTTTADDRIKSAQNVLIKYADTEFKSLMLLTIAQAYQM